MPLIDLTIPEGSIPAARSAALLDELVVRRGTASTSQCPKVRCRNAVRTG